MVILTKLSSKGQIVIPLEIREKLNLREGNLVLVSDQGDTVCLKKVELPKVKSWNEAAAPFRKAAKKSGFNKNDLDRLVLEIKAR